MKDFLTLLVKGFCVGAAIQVPAIPAATALFILGIYKRLLQALKSINLQALQLLVTLRWREFLKTADVVGLLALAIGFGAALYVVTALFPLAAMVSLYKARIYGFFFGVIFGLAVLLIWRYQTSKLWNLMMLFAGAVIGGYIWLALPGYAMPNTPLWVFAAGLIAAVAFLLPGVSAGYLLLLLEKYDLIFAAVEQQKWAYIGIFAAGFIVGLFAMARAVLWLFSRYHDSVIFFLTGLLLGSLPILWPLQYITAPQGDELLMIASCMGAGIVTIWLLHRFYRAIAQ